MTAVGYLGDAAATTLAAETAARVSADSTLSGLIAALQTALAGKVGKGDVVIRMADYADNTGATFADTGIANAQTAAGATGTIEWTAGTYKTANTTVITCNSNASPSAIISYTGTDLAVQIGGGGSGSGSLISWNRFTVPQIHYANKPTTGWDAGTVGLKIMNVFTALVKWPRITGFETGYLLYGKGFGVSYVTTLMGHLDNNKINMQLDKDATGWVNQNAFIGGRFSHNSNEGAIVAGTKHIYTKHSAGNADPNNNTWYTPSLESPGVVEYVLDIAGDYNKWDNPRFEYTPGTPNIIWRAQAHRNRIFGGFDVDRLQENFETGQFSNWVDGTSGARWAPTSSKGIVIENGGGVNFAGLTLMPPGAIAAGEDPITAYAARFQASAWKGKRHGDVDARVTVDVTNGKVLIGDGTAAPTIQWSQGIGSPEAVVTAGIGSLYSQNNGAAGTTLWAKESGTGNTGWVAMRSTKRRVTATVSTAAPTPNVANTDTYDVTALAVPATFGAPTGSPTDDQSLLIRVKDDGTGRALTWNAIYRAVGVILPTTTVAGKVLYVGCRYNTAAVRWDVLAIGSE